jgi:shikimate kinase
LRRTQGEHVVLVGMMGSGKSTVGPIVAARLGRRYADTDAEVEKAAGSTVAELFERKCERHFREEESRVLEEVLSGAAPAVVSVGGGAVLDRSNRKKMAESGTVVWLRATPATLVERLSAQQAAARPLLAGDPEGAIARLEGERRPLYQEVADVVVDVDYLSADEVAAAVLEACAGRTPEAP